MARQRTSSAVVTVKLTAAGACRRTARSRCASRTAKSDLVGQHGAEAVPGKEVEGAGGQAGFFFEGVIRIAHSAGVHDAAARLASSSGAGSPGRFPWPARCRSAPPGNRRSGSRSKCSRGSSPCRDSCCNWRRTRRYPRSRTRMVFAGMVSIARLLGRMPGFAVQDSIPAKTGQRGVCLSL